MVKKKRVVKKKTNKRAKIVSKIENHRIFSKFNFGLVLKNLSIFILLFLISWALYAVVIPRESGFSILFGVLGIIFFLVSIAFFLALLALLVLKWMKR